MAAASTTSTSTSTPSQHTTSEGIIKKCTTYANLLTESSVADENKLKAAQEISENFETIIQSSSYPAFLEHAIPKFIQFLKDGEPQFVAESTLQQIRKLLLEILHRIPTNEHLRTHYKSILSLMFHLLEIENEENVLVCLRVIIELHKQFRPPLQSEIQHFLQYVKTIYKELPVNVKQHFEVVSISATGFLPSENQGNALPGATSQSSTPVGTPAASPMSSGDGGGGKSGQQTTIPKAINSLKVLAELPIIVVLMYQLYKQNVYTVVADFIPLVMNTIVLQPSLNARKSPSFNKEIYVDFVAAQIKTLSFLAYIIRIYQEMVNTYSQNMVGGLLGLLRYCPQEVAHLRKELLIAARHILATDLRNRFVPHIDQLFDEEVLIGTGWTTRESLRPLAYSTLADLVHHVRTHLPLPHLSLAVNMFSKNVHDDSLPVSIQTMSCKLLLNLVECIRQKSDEQGSGREILMRMLEVFVRKFQSIAKHHIPAIFEKCQQASDSSSTSSTSSTSTTTAQNSTTTTTTTITSTTATSSSSSSTTTSSTAGTTPSLTTSTTTTTTTTASTGTTMNTSSTGSTSTGSTSDTAQPAAEQETATKKPTSPSPSATLSNTFSVPDCRSMVKTLVCGVKTITWGAGSCKVPGGNKTFLPWETQLFTRLLKYALQALDIYQVSVAPNGQYFLRPPSSQQVRMKEEKEILEHFAGVFTMMNTSVFKEVFSSSIEYLVERIHTNYALQIIPNSFLANPNTSATFATILVKFLLERLDEMGTNMDRSNLYLKLFKLVFGSVSLFASENEQMLKPHLHEIVNRSMELACTSKEPYNYFLLLRALFRSIGGGSHDLLYQEFLPLLPNLLQGLNNLQSGVHRQYMKDLFVELCLTVPVRLSSLLPYLPMLMDPLVSALNGSQTLVSQGLRTLELCVDNLQPDFLYDHIQPVRAELFQALWKTLRNSNDNIAHVAFRVLGKFGGGNRRMLKEPQKLTFNDADTLGPCLAVYYPESVNPVTISIGPVIERALTFLKTLPPNMTVLPQQSSINLDHTIFYRKQAWIVVKSYLVAMMSLEDTNAMLHQVLAHKSFREGQPPVVSKTVVLPCSDLPSKKILEQALTGALLSASIKELREEAVPFMCNLVRHFTLVGMVQQAGPCPIKPQNRSHRGMDVHVIAEAIATVMGMEDKEFCKVGELAVAVMIETATAVTGNAYKAAQLPLFEYLSEKLIGCCYERAWFTKSGGCTAIRFLMKRMPLKWLIEHQLSFINALFFVMMDLTNEVSAGTLDSAKEILMDLIKQCNTPQEDTENADIKTVQQKIFPTLCQHLIREIVSPNETVRKQAQSSINVLAQICGKTVYDIMAPHKSILEDMIPPKKHLLRHQPVNTQIALMDGNTFCTTLNPRLFTMDLSIVEHKVFFTELLSLCEADDAHLLKLPCYKSVQSLTPLRKSALHALSVCNYIVQAREKTFTVLYKALNSTVEEIQETAKECLKKFMSGPQIDMELVHMSIRPLLLMLGDYRNLNLPLMQRLSHLMELFPSSFNEKLCEQLLAHLKKWAEVIITVATQAQQTSGAKLPRKAEDDLKICEAIINMFHLIPAASSKLIDHLIQLVLKIEKVLMIEVGSPLRAPLLKFLVRYPSQTCDYFLLHIAEPQMNRILMHYLKMNKNAKILRTTLESYSLMLVNSLFNVQQPPEDQVAAIQKKMELQYQGILIIRLLVKFNDKWLPDHPVIIGHLRRVWISKSFQDRLNKDGSPVHRWREPKLLVKCLLNYIKHRPGEVELLFQLLRVFTVRHVPDFHFLRKFLEDRVAKGYSIQQKRHVFFQFVKLFEDQYFPQELKAKALQYVLIPMFQVSLERGKGDDLIGGPPNPEHDSSENVISVFVSKVINPDNPFGTSDAVRILLLQFSALLVEHASQYIHDVANKKQGTKLRRLMTFAWPCLLPKQCVDPSTKYHGHLLLAHIIAKFAIHKRIVLQVFHSLLKAHAVEARGVVRQALDILTPAMPARMEDGNTMLTHWTKKIIVEEGHTVAQLVHMLQLLVRHYRVYYPVRVYLIQHMVSAMQRLGFTANAIIEHRKLAVDLAEVIIKWELQRIKDEQEQVIEIEPLTPGSLKRPAEDPSTPQDTKRTRSLSQTAAATRVAVAIQESKLKSPLEKHHSDALVNFLLRIACQVNEPSTAVGSQGESLSRRCVILLKTTLKTDLWPGADLRVVWLDKLLVTVEQTPAANYANVCTAIEILTYLLSVLPQQTILTLFKPLQRGIATCMMCQNTKVIRAIHTLLGRLMTLFPLDPTATKYEELEGLYNNIGKVICDGLTNFERAANAATSILYGPLMMLKAACMHNPSYIDNLMNPFMRALQRMHKDHINAVLGESTGASEMLILCLELIKNRIGVMTAEIRKHFFTIVVTLIEKSPDSKLLRAITKIVEDWIKTKVTQLTIQHLPTLREKTVLLYRMMINYEKRFPEDFELQAQFLELVNFVYRDETLLITELASKLEPAFLSGLRCVQPHIRSRFMEVFDKTMKKKLYDRLVYIFCSQNWEAMGAHFWIKQCIELLLAVSDCERPITPSSTYSMLPSLTSFIRANDGPVAREIIKEVNNSPSGKETQTNGEQAMEIDQGKEATSKENMFLFAETDADKLFELMENQNVSTLATRVKGDHVVHDLVVSHNKFMENLRDVKSASFLGAMAQLCHSNSKLAHKIWVDLFPQLWNMLSDRQQQVLSGELSPFMCSGSHLVQADVHPSAVHSILEGVSKCDPAVPIRPCILKYLGKTHNSWHRSALTLEEYAALCDEYSNPRVAQQQQQVVDYTLYDEDATEINPNETLDNLAEMYSSLNEEDMWASLWQQRCRNPETATAIAYETQGFFEQAQNAYELAMNKAREEHNRAPASPAVLSEYKLWESHWLRCAKELGQWDLLMEFGKSKSHPNPVLVLESSWRVPDWQAMKDALSQVELNFPENIAYKLSLYRGFVAICHPDEPHLNVVDKLVEHSTSQAIRQWRRLPPIISHQHLPLLQAAQQIIELQEAAQIHIGIQPNSVGRSASLHDMKAIVKTWRNRLPMPSDNLSHWSDIFMWRHHHYQAIVAAYDGQSSHEAQQSNHAMLGVHASAWAIIHYGYIARKQNLTGVCLDSLSRIHTIPSVPIVDCFQKIRQQVKCYLQMAGSMGKTELQEVCSMGKTELQKGLEVIESTNLKYFTKEMTAEFFALKGMFLAHIGRSEDANKAFSQAVQMHDSLVKAWALWGDYLDNLFTRERNMQLGVSAIVCYLHACRHQNEAKCRKYLARTIWLMTYDDDKGSIADAVDKYCVGVPPVHWLPWIPQLLTCLVRREGQKILNLLGNIGRVYPQAMYFPIRTLYLTWKIEQRERHKVEAAAAAINRSQTTPTSVASPGSITDNKTTILSSEAVGKGITTTTLTTSLTGTAVSTSAAPTTKALATPLSTPVSTTASSEPNNGVNPSSSTNSNSSSQSDPGTIRATAQMWRCSKIMHMLRDLHPTLLSALEGIVDQMVWFRECWHEEVLRQLRQGLTKCYQVAFETRGDVSNARITPHTLSFVKKLVSTFGIGFEPASSVSTTLSTAASESLARRAQATAQDPVFQRLKEQFASDFDFSVPGAMGLHNLIGKLKKWIKILEEKAKLLPSSFLLEDRCRFLSNFTTSTAEVELPGEFLMPKANTHSPYYIRIARFMPRVELVQKYNFSARRLFIRGNNGKIYPYLVVNDACMTESRREERILQLLRLLNLYFEKRKESCKRNLLFTVPRVVAVSPQMRLIEDSPSFISLREILSKRCDCKHLESDSPIALYYERLAAVQSRGLQVTHQVLRDILREIQGTMVPEYMLKEWAQYTYTDPTDYWTFRKQFCVQLTLLGFAEFTLHLTRLGPEMLQVAQDCGRLTVTYFRFEVDDTKGELDANRPVPFRLTPNIAEFVTPVGVNGVITAAMVAAARCLVEPQFSIPSILRAVLRDEMITWHKKKQDDSHPLPNTSSPNDMDSERLITLVNGAVNAITTRLQNLAQYEGGETKVSTLIQAATSADNLCRMDPAWHPWL